MDGGVSFTLSKMEEVYLKGSECEKAYADAVSGLESNVASLAGYWTSSETGTYEAFKALFDEKLVKLKEADELMKQFLQKIDERRERYQEAAERTKGLFE